MDDIERKLWNRVDRFVWWLRFVPFLRMVAVCNNLSFSKGTSEKLPSAASTASLPCRRIGNTAVASTPCFLAYGSFSGVPKVDDDSDIDLFIVARAGRLFIVRSFSILILHVLGVRLHGKKIKGRFCLSFFIDDTALDLSKIAISR